MWLLCSIKYTLQSCYDPITCLQIKSFCFLTRIGAALSSVSSAMSLQLVCDGSRAVAGSSLHQHQGKSLFPALTQDATLFCRDVVCLQDGQHEASYIGRGVHRDVYRVGDVIMKLATVATEEQLCSNFLEAAALALSRAVHYREQAMSRFFCQLHYADYELHTHDIRGAFSRRVDV